MTDIVDMLRESCSRDGKPSGIHMIDGQRQIAKVFSQSDNEDARNIADVAACMAHCIENEALLFECLKTVALEAATLIEQLRADNARLRAAVSWAMPALEDLVENNEIDEHEVCGDDYLCCAACHQSGCLSAKLQIARAALQETTDDR